MREAGMAEPDDIERLIQTMERFGFAERHTDGSFTFRPPAYRFLDLCLETASRMPADTPHDEPAEPPPTDDHDDA
jgi:hypothetical protein